MTCLRAETLNDGKGCGDTATERDFTRSGWQRVRVLSTDQLIQAHFTCQVLTLLLRAFSMLLHCRQHLLRRSQIITETSVD